MGRSLEMTVYGCDISHYQAGVPAGMDFVFHKCTEAANYVDVDYQVRHDAARAEGLQWGAYHFFRMSASPASQVNWFKANAFIKPGDIIALDFEDVSYDPWANWTASQVAAQATNIMWLLRQAYPNNRILLYCNESTLTGYVEPFNIPVHDGLWIADYSAKPTKFVFWQYTSTPIDKDLSDSFANVAELHAWANPTPPPSIQESDMFTPIAVDMPNGRAYTVMEVGSNSTVVSNAWVAVKALWGDITGVVVTFTNDSAAVTKQFTVDLKKNVRLWWELPSGTSAATFEWDHTKVTIPTILDGYLIGK